MATCQRAGDPYTGGRKGHEGCRSSPFVGVILDWKDAVENPANLSFFARHEFLLRRLHSLSGLIPVGAYMVVHLLTNASVLGGPASFQDQVDTIHRLGPILPLVEWTF